MLAPEYLRDVLNISNLNLRWVRNTRRLRNDPTAGVEYLAFFYKTHDLGKLLPEDAIRYRGDLEKSGKRFMRITDSLGIEVNRHMSESIAAYRLLQLNVLAARSMRM